MNLHIVILAAGQGTRMRSRLPKVLHPLGGIPLLAHVLGTARRLEPESVHVVYGHGGEILPQSLPDAAVRWVLQAEQLGTGHAVAQALGAVPDDALVLVLYGDVPLIDTATLRRLTEAADRETLALLTAVLPDPSGYGRIVRNAQGAVERIVEHKDARPEELAIAEINTGMLAAPAARLRRWLAGLDNHNAQGEYYLTDCIALAVREGMRVQTAAPDTLTEVQGVNDRVQLAELERAYQRGQAERLMRAGVTLLDPARFDLRGELTVGEDVTIDVDVIIEGRVQLGEGVRVGAYTVLRDAVIGPGTEILPHSVLEGAEIGPGCRIGPFARVRPDTVLSADVHVGNFVELKKSTVGEGSKLNHLSYVGDTQIGARVNIGAGTITCNYDGANKHRTVIGDDAFIGSDTQLVAPVEVGPGATIGAGSTITRDAPAGQLTLSRTAQRSVPGWQRPVKGGGKPKSGS
jgi:bifunctional UDP-N-acetylglucosamine pyrophosphorylase / glucosamine-1-phosphate N-acetyltransferase